MDGSSDTIERLKKLAKSQPRYTPGQAPLPFGDIEYVDAFTLDIQYREIFVDGLYDYVTEKDHPFILDCGGNIGLSVIRYKQRHPGARLLTFEADPTICQVLERNVSNLEIADVQIECAAAWVSEGTARFHVEGAEGGRLCPEGNVMVPTIRLADLLTEEVDLLKLDIEGGEWQVLEDICSSGGLTRINNMIIEFHGWPNEARKMGPILMGLDDAGFRYTFPWSFCEPDLAGPPEPTPFPYAKDAKFILFLHAWRPS